MSETPDETRTANYATPGMVVIGNTTFFPDDPLWNWAKRQVSGWTVIHVSPIPYERETAATRAGRRRLLRTIRREFSVFERHGRIVRRKGGPPWRGLGREAPAVEALPADARLTPPAHDRGPHSGDQR